ncbi:MAG: hypothetical protein Q9195_006062 [Heterodermia aff. obscurata]
MLIFIVTTTLYNNTSVLNRQTIYGDLNVLTDQVYRGEKDTSIIAEAQSIVTAVSNEGYWGGLSVAWSLVNGTDDGGVSIPYPTPYYEVSELVSYKVNGPCARSCYVDVAYAIELGHFGNITTTAYGCSTTDGQYYLEKPYFQTITDARFNISDFAVPHWQGAIDTVSLKSWMAADRRLMSIAPDVLSCSVLDEFDGPPGIKIPVSALTATSGITVTGTYSTPSRTPAPASQPTTSTVPATPKPSPTPSKPTAQEDEPTQQGSESAIETSHTVDDHAHSSWITSSVENTETIVTDMPADNPVLTLGGSHYTRNSQSEIVLPGLTLKPGQAATISNTPISLDSAGSYVVVGTKTQSLTPAFAPDAPEGPAVLTIEGATYTVDQDSDHFVIDGTSLHRGSTITVAGTPVAFGPDGNYAVIGTRTQPLTVASLNDDAAPVINVAGTSYTLQSDSGDYIIAGQTLSNGGKITVAGNVVSLVSDQKGAAVDFSVGHFITSAPVASVQPKPVITFGGSTYTARPGSHDFVIDGQTLTQGGEITVSGVDISYPTGSYIVIGSSTQQFGATRAAELTFAGSTLTADTYGNFVVDGQTLEPGGVIIVDSTAISYAADSANVVIGSNTRLFAVPTGHEPTITFQGSTYTADAASDFVIGGQTLIPGGVITVNGISMSYDADGTDIVVGSQTQYFATGADYGSTITFEGSTYTVNAAGDFLIAGQTLTPGGVITVDGTPISYDAGGTDVVVGSETQYFATGANYGSTITFEGSTYTANSAGDFLIAGQTLTPGGAITVDGTPVSYAADKSDVVVGTSTEAVGLGSYIIGGFGSGFGTATAGGSNYTGAVFSSWAGGQYDSLLNWRRIILIGIVVIISIIM